MRVKAIFEGHEAVLTIEHETDREKALLAAFGLDASQLVADAESQRDSYGLKSVRITVRRKRAEGEVYAALDPAQ